MDGPDSVTRDERSGDGWAALEALAPRVKTVLVLGYLGTVAAAILLPLAWGSTWAYGHAALVAAPVSLVWFGLALYLAPALDRRWPRQRLAGTRSVVPPPPLTADGAVAQVRRAGRRGGVLRVPVLAVLVPLAVATTWAVVATTSRDADIVRRGPAVTVLVVAVDRSFPTRSGLPSAVTVELDGRTIDLYGDLPDAEVGEWRTVVVDPSDPGRVLDVQTHTGGVYSTWQTWLLGLTFGGLILAMTNRAWLPRPGAWTLGRAHTATEVDVVKDEDGTLRLSTGTGELVWAGGDWPDPVLSARCWAVGDLRDGAWVAIVRGRTVEWPARRLRSAGTGAPSDPRR